MCARDARFDGVFFVGVSTTGIYCRPVCPARTPARRRCEFFALAAEAERAGYRACFRCRPELAPGMAPVDARSRLSRRAAALVDAGFLNGRTVDDLAARLGVSARQLRRAMEAELGVSPVELAQARRLAMAKQLLHDTRLPLAEVALSSGFASVRRFNALFQARFHRAPSAIRGARREVRGGDAGGADDTIRLRLDYRAPLDWPTLLAFLSARAIQGVESITESRYRRTVALAPGGWLEVGARHDRPALEARVSLSLAPHLPRIVARLRALFDLDARPDAIASHLGTDPRLAPSLQAHPGLRVPGAFDGYEMAVRAVLGQQVTVRGATTLCGRLVAAHGRAAPSGIAGLDRWFPEPERIAALSVDELRRIGLPEARARTLRELSRAVVEGTVDLSNMAAPERVIERLLAIPGIGPWTASYLAMRALGWPDAMPAGDLGVRKALGTISTRDVEALAAAWRPWRAYAVMHLWTLLGDKG